MIRKLSIHILAYCICTTSALLSSSNIHIPHMDATLTKLAQELSVYNKEHIENYQWEDANDHVYHEEPINREERTKIGSIIQQLMAHRQNDKPLSNLVSSENQLHIQEGFFNVLFNSRTAEQEAAKQWYDQAFGPGKFHEKYGNYTKSIQFSPAHKYAVTVWKNEIIKQNNLSINNLANISQNAMNTTADAWLQLKQDIDQKMNDQTI